MGNKLQQIIGFISRHIIKRSAISNWRKRAKTYGTRAALNIGHSAEEVDAVTAMQREKIFPILKHALTGREKTMLDFGCGPGRFTLDLAELTQGDVIGVDPIQEFLNMAPKHQNVEYRLIKQGVIPVIDKSIDIVWICLVLGGIIKRRELNNVVSEIDRVLKPGGLIVLIENTTDAEDRQYWSFRTIEFYKSLFSFAELEHSSNYYDLGELNSILVGRKHV